MMRLIRTFATAGLMLAAAPAAAQHPSTINGVPADTQAIGFLLRMCLRSGDYWLAPNGSWGVIGSTEALGNVRADGRRRVGSLGDARARPVSMSLAGAACPGGTGCGGAGARASC